MVSFPKKYADILFFDKFGYTIDWKHPRDLNEIINYLSFKTDTTMWSRCADKYAVRDYVKEKGLEKLLIPELGHWEKPEDIPFDDLPRPFVLKMNNGYGDVICVLNDDYITKQNIIEHFNKVIQHKFGRATAEPHYRRIKPLIIAEKYIAPDENPLVDYKVWCFNGEPHCILTVSQRDRRNHIGKVAVYTKNWERQDSNISEKRRNEIPVKKPERLLDMLKYASILSEGFPQVRVDFYEVDGVVYFGEMTFTAAAGRMDSFTSEYLKELARLINFRN